MFKINSIKFAANKMAIIIIFQLSAFLQICQLNTSSILSLKYTAKMCYYFTTKFALKDVL